MIVKPTGVERIFGVNEVIVTKTDLKGRITYANEVFCRVCRLTEAEALGKPHNLIRHPDMPRGVFQLLWDTIGGGHEIFAYVKNLALDGAHYWVLAHVTPSFDEAGKIVGYHSNRRLADRRAVMDIAPIYDEIRAVEGRYPNAHEAALAGAQALMGMFDERKTDYDHFVWSLAGRRAA
jgi:PAS domain S-box-containing protein